MQLNDPRTGIDVLDRDAALVLLAGEVVGRLGVVDHGSPRIFPVNYVLDGETIVFRTAPGTKLLAGPRSPACFEIDSFDREHRTGWSVLATGPLEEVDHYDRAWAHLHDLPVDPWAAGTKDHVMRLRIDFAGGRRVS